ncbi:MAG: VanZ family protein [Verrucomicrobiota bacterium]
MSRSRVFLKYWLPVLLWMALIFTASTDALSSNKTSRFIGPVLLWLKPDLEPETVERIVFIVRKTAHVAEYGILSILAWRAFWQPVRGDQRSWQWKPALRALALAVCYAATDEWHQTFTANRWGTVADVLLDSAGALAGIIFLWLCWNWRAKLHTGSESGA